MTVDIYLEIERARKWM